jgi:uncharacterized protein
MPCMRIVCKSCQRVLEDAPSDYPPRPFCSMRCKLADLSNWLNEKYSISTPVNQDDSEESLH